MQGLLGQEPRWRIRPSRPHPGTIDVAPRADRRLESGGRVGAQPRIQACYAIARQTVRRCGVHVPPGGASSTPAAHVDHLRCGLKLLNPLEPRGESFADADYSASWRRVTVTDSEWVLLREQLRAKARTWQEAVQRPRKLTNDELNGLVGSVVHLAYHLGAIRQIDRSTRGPSARD